MRAGAAAILGDLGPYGLELVGGPAMKSAPSPFDPFQMPSAVSIAFLAVAAPCSGDRLAVESK